MTPHDVVADASLRLRFQTEVAYLDRMQPSGGEVSDDTELLASKDGVLVVAWLWPRPLYDSDPFNAVSRWNRGLRENIAARPRQDDDEEAFQTTSRAIDRRRERLREVASARFVRIVESIARAVDHSVEELKTHLAWSVPLSELELDRLLHADSPFPLRVIIRICNALHLDFVDEAWALVDPQRLARRIDQSVLASGISEYLRTLATDDLANMGRRLPRRPVDAGQAQQPDLYPAPAPGGRYCSLYEALAVDERDDPDYTLDEIDRILDGAGEMPLPASARDRSWWAGNGAKAEGRPQVSAWWAAGYRIRNLVPPTGPVVSVGFEALPGRAGWLANPERSAMREYSVPGPPQVPIYPVDERALNSMRAALSVLAAATKQLTDQVDVKGLDAALAQIAAAIDHVKDLNRSDVDPRAELEANAPDDPDIRRLVKFLEEVDEASRSRIVDHFNQVRNEPVVDAWMTNLLTKARRQGWTTNKGTRSQPRWALSRRCPACGMRTLQPYSAHRLKCAQCGTVVPRNDTVTSAEG